MSAETTRYPDANVAGEVLAVHCRQGSGSGKSVWWELPDGTPGLGGMSLAGLPLYGSESLGSAGSVVFTEGEKACRALLDVGVPAVGSVTGASSTPGPEALAILADRDVYLWPDADRVGAEHMARIGNLLDPIASFVYVIRWPGAREHDDAADYVAAGLDPRRLIDAARWSAVVDAVETVAACRRFYGPTWAEVLPATADRLGRIVHLDIAAAQTAAELGAALDTTYPPEPRQPVLDGPRRAPRYEAAPMMAGATI